jgi:hypothetical protein
MPTKQTLKRQPTYFQRRSVHEMLVGFYDLEMLEILSHLVKVIHF